MRGSQKSVVVGGFVIAICSLVANPASALGGFTMSFSVYNDLTSSTTSSNLVAYSNVSDNSTCYQHSSFLTTVTIRSPSGRSASRQTSGLSANTSLTIAGEGGNYHVTTNGTYHCGCSGLNLGFGYDNFPVRIGFYASRYQRTTQTCLGLTRYNRYNCTEGCQSDYTCWSNVGQFLVITGTTVNGICIAGVRHGYATLPQQFTCFKADP